jgi:flagellar protein FliS
MTLQAIRSQQLSQLNRDAILSAPPARLLTMLYDRLILDLTRAEQAQTTSDWETARVNLLHAQDIVRELAGSLKMGTWDGAEQLQSIYTYVLTALMNANMHRDVEPTRECIELLRPIGEAWHAAADSLVVQAPVRAGGGMLGVG